MRSAAAKDGLELREGHFDRVEVRRIGREVSQFGAGSLDRLSHAMHFMGWQIVHDHGLARRQCRGQNLFDVGQEGITIHPPLQQHRRGQPVDAQASDKSRGHPMAMRDARHASLTFRCASAQPRYLGGGTGLIDEDKPRRIQVELLLEPTSRAAATSGRCCSAACAVFFEHDAASVKEAPKRPDPNISTARCELGLQLGQCDVGPGPTLGQHEVGMGFNARGLGVATLLLRRELPSSRSLARQRMALDTLTLKRVAAS